MNDSEEVALQIQRALSGKNQHFEFWGLNSKNEPFPKSVSLTQGNFFGEKCVIATARCITEQIEAREKLQKSEERYRDLVEKMQEGLVVFDENFTITFVNNYFCQMLDFKENSEIVGDMSFTSLIEPSSVISFFEKINNLQNNPTIRFELQLQRPDGILIEVIINALVVTNPDDNKLVYMATCLDISDIKRIETELIFAKEKAEESDRLKSAFLANMSHEIRTPMNSILGFANILTETDLNNEDRCEYARILNASGIRLLNTVNDLLDISRLDSGQIQLHLTDFKACDLLLELYKMNEISFQDKSLYLKLNVEPSVINKHIYSDEHKIYQIMNNFLNNALKFTLEGGVEFGCKMKESSIEFYVKDTGIGIEQDKHDLIFGRFTQENHNYSRNHEGSGLGLAISKGLADLLGGTLLLKSTKNFGSTFTFLLPVTVSNDNNKTTAESEKDFEYKDLDKCIILIAEDDMTNYTLIQKIISRETKAKIIHAHDGIEAVELFHDTPGICIVIMDMKMPRMDGFEASRIIRKLNPDVPILAVTAFAISGDKEKIIKNGCSDYISKPLNAKLLIHKIYGLLKYKLQNEN